MSSNSHPPLPTSRFGQNSSFNPFLGKGIASQGFDWTAFLPSPQTTSSPSPASTGSTTPSGNPTPTHPAASGFSSSSRNTILIVSAITIVCIVCILSIFLLIRYRKKSRRKQEDLRSTPTSLRIERDPEQGHVEPFPIKSPPLASASPQPLDPFPPNQPQLPTSIRSLKQHYQRLNDNAVVSSSPVPTPSSPTHSPFHKTHERLNRTATQSNPSRSQAPPNNTRDDPNATTLEQRVDALQRIMEQVSEEITLGRIAANAEPPPSFASLNPGYPAEASQNTDRSSPVEAPPDYSSGREGQGGEVGH